MSTRDSKYKKKEFSHCHIQRSPTCLLLNVASDATRAKFPRYHNFESVFRGHNSRHIFSLYCMISTICLVSYRVKFSRYFFGEYDIPAFFSHCPKSPFFNCFYHILNVSVHFVTGKVSSMNWGTCITQNLTFDIG